MALTTGLALCPSGTYAQIARPSTEVIEATNNGQINWSSGWIQATGRGYSPNNVPPSLSKTLGERAGYAIALRNLLEVIKGVRVDSESFVKGHMDDNQTIKTKVTGLVQGAEIIQSSAKEDGGIEVLVKAPLWGIDSGSLISAFHKQGTPNTPLASATNAAVLIDARGLGITPALLPSIVSEQGKEVYSPSKVDPRVLEQSGAAKYFSLSKDIDLQSYFYPNVYVIRPVIRKSDVLSLSGTIPLSIRGISASGSLRSTLVINAEDSAKLDQNPGAANALSEGNIIIVIDPLTPKSSSRSGTYQ
jgi:hypothetical protein